MLRTVVALIIFSIVVAFGAGGPTANPSEAAPGDLVADVVIGEGSDAGPGGPNDGVGVAFNGRYLYYSAGFFDPILHRVDTSGGNHLDVTVTDSVSGSPVIVQAMSWDAGRSRIWAANGSAIYLVHPTMGVAQFQFNTGVACGLDDGLAYDGTDDSIWWSCDHATTVYHFDTDGTLLDSFPLNGQMVPECGFDYSSGIAVGGDILYLGANGCDFYFTFDKDGNKLEAFDYPALRSEDLECDPTTFAPKAKEVMWIRDAYDGHIRAFEVLPGTCGGGGSSPPPRRAIVYIQGIVSESSCTDSDEPPNGEDGFLDRAPRWLNDYLRTTGWIAAEVNVTESVYFSYSGNYCDGGTGENGAVPDYDPIDTCNRGIDEFYYEELRALIERVTNLAPGTKVSMVAHSQGGLIASYLVGRLRSEDPDFVRQRIASVITFDSFPEGLPPIAFPTLLEELYRGTCGDNPPNLDDWNSDSAVGQTADDAAQPFPDDRYQVAFYTLDAGGLGPPDNLTDIEGERLHEQFGEDNHTTVWDRENERKRELVGCSVTASNDASDPANLTDDCRIDVLHGVDSIMPGETRLASADVPVGATSAGYTASWKTSTVRLTPITPSGVRIDPLDLPEGASHSLGLNFETYEFTDPEPGTWTLELFGEDVPPEGEEVTVLVDITVVDTDGDGIPDAGDSCPEEPEDADGFQDADGCPDPDNDGDGILDINDACPNDPEDVDGFQDGDGCPDPDNDGDGILDADDACPNDPEDADGFQDSDGCADPDNDGDGILDAADACPNDPEDVDGFQDGDGCPDPDNDGDGIPDNGDACPNDPEDVDGFQDNDGCPDSDNDGDGIPDDTDNCPLHPNPGQSDADGDEFGDACDPDFVAPTPTREVLWTDVDCDGDVDIGDAQKIARSLINLDVSQEPGCPEIGSSVEVDGVTRIWGDADCDGDVDIGDAQKKARSLINLDVSQEPGCPAIGATVQIPAT